MEYCNADILVFYPMQLTLFPTFIWNFRCFYGKEIWDLKFLK